MNPEPSARHGVRVDRADYDDLYRRGMRVLDEWTMRSGLDAAGMTRLKAQVAEHCRSAIRREATVHDDADRLLRQLPAHVRHGVATSAWHADVEAVHAATGIGDRLTFLVTGDETVGRSKPDPYPLLLAAERMGIAPETCLYVGDCPHDVEAANAAGMGSGIILRPHTPEDADEEARHVFQSMDEILVLL